VTSFSPKWAQSIDASPASPQSEASRHPCRPSTEDITVLNLTRAAQAAIDLAAHVVATKGYGLPEHGGR
jgi:hypothetical protein